MPRPGIEAAVELAKIESGQPQFAAIEAKLNVVVPGWRTSEFWVTIGALAAGAAGMFHGNAAVIAAGVASGAYAISRAITKFGSAAR